MKLPIAAYVVMAALIALIVLAGLFYKMPESGPFAGFGMPASASASKGLSDPGKRR